MAEARTPQDDEEDWNAGWDEHRRLQLTLGLDATPAQRLAWLEEMIAFAFSTGALPKRTGKDDDR